MCQGRGTGPFSVEDGRENCPGAAHSHCGEYQRKRENAQCPRGECLP